MNFRNHLRKLCLAIKVSRKNIQIFPVNIFFFVCIFEQSTIFWQNLNNSGARRNLQEPIANYMRLRLNNEVIL